MKKTFTPKPFEVFNNEKEEVVVPSNKTLDFLRQFARNYYVEKSLPKSLNELYLN